MHSFLPDKPLMDTRSADFRLSTEKQLLLQGHELHRLQGHNRWALAP